jgi:hypothetical protein
MDNQIGTNSLSRWLDDSVADIPYPDGFDSMCTGCRSLEYMYGPEDSELADHIRHGHRDPDMDADPIPFVPFDSQIDNISYSLTELGLLLSESESKSGKDNSSTTNSTKNKNK